MRDLLLAIERHAEEMRWQADYSRRQIASGPTTGAANAARYAVLADDLEAAADLLEREADAVVVD